LGGSSWSVAKATTTQKIKNFIEQQMDKCKYMDIRKLINKFGKGGTPEFRQGMIMYAKKYGISKTAEHYETTRKTVRKWVKAYNEKGFEGLKNKSRKDQFHPKKLDDETEKRIIDYRDKTEFGAFFIKENLQLNCSESTIHRKLKQNGKVKKDSTKYTKKRDMTYMRNYVTVLKKNQIDVKYLTDIPNILSDVMINNLPKYQITARDYKTGLTFISFAHEKSNTSVGIFTDYLIEHLKNAGIDVTKSHFQSDNGGEFRYLAKKTGFTMFEEVCMRNGVNYRFIPPASPTFNSDVESFHQRIEKELYNNENFRNEGELLYKSFVYMLWYNLLRKNRNKEKKSPADLLKINNFEKYENICMFQPIIVDKYIKDIKLVKQGGYFNMKAPILTTLIVNFLVFHITIYIFR
jgi:transposase